VNIEDIYGKTEMEIEPFNKKINEISIPFEEYDLQNCKINFMKFNRILILKRDNYTIYIYKNDHRNQIKNNRFKTKILSINLIKDVHTIVNLSTSKINQIQKQNNEFYLSLKELLKRNIETTQIKYFECEINDGKINLNKNIYYEISGNKATRINNINLNESELTQEDNTLNGIQKIEDFLKIELTSEFYKFKEKRSKEDQIFCKNCNLI
jgi:predicted metallo-beta-lactamase superfamily hydrolase